MSVDDLRKYAPKTCRDCRNFFLCKYRERFSHGDIPVGLGITPKTALKCGMKIRGDVFGRELL
jgi:hypothetical protein